MMLVHARSQNFNLSGTQSSHVIRFQLILCFIRALMTHVHRCHHARLPWLAALWLCGLDDPTFVSRSRLDEDDLAAAPPPPPPPPHSLWVPVLRAMKAQPVVAQVAAHNVSGPLASLPTSFSFSSIHNICFLLLLFAQSRLVPQQRVVQNLPLRPRCRACRQV
jgi:hypothetical protein